MDWKLFGVMVLVGTAGATILWWAICLATGKPPRELFAMWLGGILTNAAFSFIRAYESGRRF